MILLYWYERQCEKMSFEDLKPYLPEYVERITERSRTQRNQYVCPLCGSGTGKNHTGAFTIFPDHHWKCFYSTRSSVMSKMRVEKGLMTPAPREP